MRPFDIADFLIFVFAIVSAITVHEWAHAFSADRLGDSTPRSQGRVTLFPLAHLDPMGSLFMVATYFTGFGIGWGRPVLTNPDNYRMNRRIAGSLVAFAGPLSNLILAGLFALVVRAGVFAEGDAFNVLSLRIVSTNLLLFFFNLIPLFPLDGSHLLANAMPPALAQSYYEFMGRWGTLLFLGLALSGLLGTLIFPPAANVFAFLTGRSLTGRLL